jgi:hypothetical protein
MSPGWQWNNWRRLSRLVTWYDALFCQTSITTHLVTRFTCMFTHLLQVAEKRRRKIEQKIISDKDFCDILSKRLDEGH